MGFLVIIVSIIILILVIGCGIALARFIFPILILAGLAAIFINFGPAMLTIIGEYLLIPVVAFSLVTAIIAKIKQ